MVLNKGILPLYKTNCEYCQEFYTGLATTRLQKEDWRTQEK